MEEYSAQVTETDNDDSNLASASGPDMIMAAAATDPPADPVGNSERSRIKKRS